MFAKEFSELLRTISRLNQPYINAVAEAIGLERSTLGRNLTMNHSLTELSLSEALVVLAATSLLMLPLSGALLEPRAEKSQQALPLKQVLDEAVSHRGFWLLSLGFFVCGFHVVFIVKLDCDFWLFFLFLFSSRGRIRSRLTALPSKQHARTA